MDDTSCHIHIIIGAIKIDAIDNLVPKPTSFQSQPVVLSDNFYLILLLNPRQFILSQNSPGQMHTYAHSAEFGGEKDRTNSSDVFHFLGHFQFLST
jgi:hypothetical protein